MNAKGTACGKFILIGEHFVVSGVPALAFPLEELWCEVKLSPSEYPQYTADVPGNEDREVIESLMARAVYAAADSLRIDISAQSFKVESRSNFPISRGLGSSASFAVALTRALDNFRMSIINEHADWQELLKSTAAIEKIFHGKPSGVDAGVILSKRPIRFENGGILRELSNKAVDFVIVDSGTRDNCAALIQHVGKFREGNPEQWQKMAHAVTELADRCETALNSGDAAAVAACVQQSHGILSELGLSSPVIDEILEEARSHGALAGKVSGAGGGGAVLLVTRQGQGKALAARMQECGRSVVALSRGGSHA